MVMAIETSEEKKKEEEEEGVHPVYAPIAGAASSNQSATVSALVLIHAMLVFATSIDCSYARVADPKFLPSPKAISY